MVCPFCQTPVPSGREVPGGGLSEAERYEKYPSVSPLPPAAIRKYENFLKQEKEENERRNREERQEKQSEPEKQPEAEKQQRAEKQSEPEKKAEEAEKGKSRIWRRRTPKQKEERGEPNPFRQDQDPPVESRLYRQLVSPGRGQKALMSAACILVLLLAFTLFWDKGIELWDWLSRKGLGSAFDIVEPRFVNNVILAMLSTAIALILGGILAYVRVRRVPLLSWVSSLHMGFVCRVPEALWLCFVVFLWDWMWSIDPYSNFEYVWIYGILGSAYLAAAFCRSAKRLTEEERKKLPLRDFLRQIWRNGVLAYAGVPGGKNQGVGREVRRLFQGTTLITLIYNSKITIEELTVYLLRSANMQALIWEIVVFAAADGIVSLLWGMIIRKAAAADREVRYGS